MFVKEQSEPKKNAAFKRCQKFVSNRNPPVLGTSGAGPPEPTPRLHRVELKKRCWLQRPPVRQAFAFVREQYRGLVSGSEKNATHLPHNARSRLLQRSISINEGFWRIELNVNSLRGLANEEHIKTIASCCVLSSWKRRVGDHSGASEAVPSLLLELSMAFGAMFASWLAFTEQLVNSDNDVKARFFRPSQFLTFQRRHRS